MFIFDGGKGFISLSIIIMKKQILLLFLTLAGLNVSFASRIYSNFDIARWYLDSKYALVGSVIQIDTIIINEVDSTINDTTFLSYKLIKEVYRFRMDSCLKASISDSVLVLQSPEFIIDYAKYTEVCHYVNDSLISCRYSTSIPNCDATNGRINLNKKVVIFYDDISNGITYSSENLDSDILILNEVNEKGESYFFSYLIDNNADESIFIGPNPFSQYLIMHSKLANNCSISIFNLQGKAFIDKKRIDNNESILDVSFLETGFYFYSVYNEDGAILKTSVLNKVP